MPPLLIATANPGKWREMSLMLGGISVPLKGLKDLSVPWEEPEESADSMRGNAEIKARYFSQVSGFLTIAEDSGIEIEALPGKFGVRTRRELTAKDDMDWLTQFLDLIRPLENRRARFCSVWVYADPQTQECHSFSGVVQGELVDFPQTPLEAGLPLSAVFIPEGQAQVFAAMSAAEKERYSHRGQAGAQFLQWWNQPKKP